MPVQPIASPSISEADEAVRLAYTGKRIGKGVLPVELVELIPVLLHKLKAKPAPDAPYMIVGDLGVFDWSLAPCMIAREVESRTCCFEGPENPKGRTSLSELS
jgi:hypothetical protein